MKVIQKLKISNWTFKINNIAILKESDWGTGAGEGGRQLKQLEHRQYFQYMFTFIQVLTGVASIQSTGARTILAILARKVLELQVLRQLDQGQPWRS